MARGGFGEALAGDDAEVSHVVLEHDEHEGRKGYNPEKAVAEGGASGKVGGPVAGVDEADGHEEAGTNIAENVKAAAVATFAHLPVLLPVA